MLPATTRKGQVTGENPGPLAVMVRGPVSSLGRMSSWPAKVPSAAGWVGAAAAVMPGCQVNVTGAPGGKSTPRTEVTNPGLPIGGTATMRGCRMRSGVRATWSPGWASVPVVVRTAVIVVCRAATGDSTTCTTSLPPGDRSPSTQAPPEQPAGSGSLGTPAGRPSDRRSPVAGAWPLLRTV